MPSKSIPMAKISVTVIFLLLIFTLSHARIPSDQPEKEVINRETRNSLPRSDVTSPIRLPSEKSSVHDHPVDSTNGESSTVTYTTLPLNSVRFRPIPRDFLTLRTRISQGGIPCRHSHRHPFPRIFRPLEHREEIPYGGDMILSNGANDIDRIKLNGGARQIPSRWLRLDHRPDHPFRHYYDIAAEEKVSENERQIPPGLFRLDHHHFRHHHHDAAEEKALEHHHHHDDDDDDDAAEVKALKHHHHDDDDDDDDEAEEKALKHHRFLHHHDVDDAAEENALKHEKKAKKGGFVKRFRKFLKQFDF